MSRTPASIEIPVVRGSTWEDYFDYLDDDDQPIDLTGYEARAQVRFFEDRFDLTVTPVLELLSTGATPRLFLEIPPGGTVKNRVRVRVEAADTEALNPDNERRVRAWIGLELYIPAGVDPEYVLPYAQGPVSVSAESVF